MRGAAQRSADDAAIATGASASFGFNGSWSGSNPVPESFALNGVACTGTVPALYTNADQGRLDALNATFDTLDDPNLAATVHFYGFWPFSVNIAGGTRYNAEVEQDLIGTFDRVHDSFVERGIPVIVGEWALLNWDHNRPA